MVRLTIQLLVRSALCQSWILSHFPSDSQSCEQAPMAIYVSEDFSNFNFSMVSAIQDSSYPATCGSVDTQQCCYASSNVDYTGGIGSAILIEDQNLQDLTSLFPETANGKRYLNMKVIQSPLFGSLLDIFFLCNGQCIDGTIRCFANQTASLFTDPSCENQVLQFQLDSNTTTYEGAFGTFEMQLVTIQSGTFRHRYKTFVPSNIATFKLSPIGYTTTMISMIISTMITVILLIASWMALWNKQSYFRFAECGFTSFWCIFVVVMFLLETVNIDTRPLISIADPAYGISSLIYVLLSSRMLLEYAIIPTFAAIDPQILKASVYVGLVSVHFLMCWPFYLAFLGMYGILEIDIYWTWYPFGDFWILIMLVFNGLVSVVWIVTLRSYRINRGNNLARLPSINQHLGNAFKKDPLILAILSGQILLIFLHIFVMYLFIQIEVTMEFIGDEMVYFSLYAVQCLIITLHYLLMSFFIYRMKIAFRKQAVKPSLPLPEILPRKKLGTLS